MVFFFFKAEDGIRDVAVTGVQTCALPIPPCQAPRNRPRRRRNPRGAAPGASSLSEKAPAHSRDRLQASLATREHPQRTTIPAAGRRNLRGVARPLAPRVICRAPAAWRNHLAELANLRRVPAEPGLGLCILPTIHRGG